MVAYNDTINGTQEVQQIIIFNASLQTDMEFRLTFDGVQTSKISKHYI